MEIRVTFEQYMDGLITFAELVASLAFEQLQREEREAQKRIANY